MNSRHHLLLSLLLVFSSGSLTGQGYTHEMLGYINQKAMSPHAYVIEKFRTYDVILLGEHHLVRQNLRFVEQLIPELHRNGIYTIGMEFGAAEDQRVLDSLITAPVYSQETAMQLMFNYNTTWGYQEYIDIYKAVWTFNRTLSAGQRKFRVLNLSYVFQWKGFDGKRYPESMARVFHKGTVDQFRAKIIETAIVDNHEKILALVGTPHAYTRYGSPYFLYNGDGFCAFDRNWLGNRLFERYPNHVFSILLHQPFMKEEDGQYQWVSPANGSVESVMAQHQNKPVGFDLRGTPLGSMKDNSQHAMCYPGFTLGQFFDGYIFLAPLGKLEGCTPIRDFVHEGNIRHALEQFPDPDWHEQVTTLEEMRVFIKKNAQRIVEECKDL